MVRRVAPLLVIGRKNRAQVQLLAHRVAHEMRHLVEHLADGLGVAIRRDE